MDRVSNGRQTIDYYLTVTFGMSLHVEFCCCLNHFDKNSKKKFLVIMMKINSFTLKATIGSVIVNEKHQY